MLNQRGEEFYGSGIITNTVPANLDSIKVLKHERNVTKEPIRIPANQKVNKVLGQNYYKDYLKESTDEQNYDEAQQLHFQQAINFIEPVENQNLDFDGDGNPDMDYGDGIINSLMGEDLEEEEQQIKEKSIKEKVNEKPIIESERQLQGQQKQPTMEGNKDNKLKNTDNRTNKEVMRMGDMVALGAGALAVAMMVMSKNM